ncbi:pentatricopeptide repeat (PPR) superfamily protein [Actinidia rufa]|uniref:Pentatricopeptide repeat (PPR) superfamily protein n=1 Tax=Actinidia rufa TaxID=165716 RepID=A0A7J0G2K6_9ERIC|nr:pentatricopeptide repeat (PPR) superfamily protein [Actinidia rufa]
MWRRALNLLQQRHFSSSPLNQKTNTDEAWKSFKALTNSSSFPSKPLTNSLITHLSSLTDTHNLKRAFASVVFLLEKNPNLLEYGTVDTLLNSMKESNTSAPAYALVKCMFKNRYFMPFHIWGNVLVEISRKNGNFEAFWVFLMRIVGLLWMRS